MSATESVSFAGDSLLKITDVIARTSMGKTTIYRKIEQKAFPAPVALGPKSVRWLKSEVDQWIASLKQQAAA
ncbi:AlpA family transcriptional regulator [Rhizobium sp. 18065]|uniref:helix-turn-helix transcriptional regulator n=1 Tax=Rhizobium sp. 18065 TaxID=2681411 RepID=UPI00135797BB|nr:AlpA family transcriptional regulator [Rhizobium sp. 18065]